MSDARQAAAAETLFDRFLPNLFLLEPNPGIVIQREDACLAGLSRVAPPHADADLLRVFSMLRPTSGAPLTARGLLDRVLGDARVANCVAQFGADADPGVRHALQKTPNGELLPRGTRFLVRELVGCHVLDKPTKVGANDGLDLQHAVVPAAYCEFVLVDEYWAQQLNRVRPRIERAGGRVPMAAAYSNTSDGVERCLAALAGARSGPVPTRGGRLSEW
jgi:hypothetical protein